VSAPTALDSRLQAVGLSQREPYPEGGGRRATGPGLRKLPFCHVARGYGRIVKVALVGWISLLGIVTGCAHIPFHGTLATTIGRMSFYEALPVQCPPEDAAPVNGIYYRLVSQTTKEEDFHSYKLQGIWPLAFPKVSECQACSLSVFDDESEARRISLLPNQLGKRILKLWLVDKHGSIKQTGKKHHHSWWRHCDFCLAECEKALADE
jgi:hypothetical protein